MNMCKNFSTRNLATCALIYACLTLTGYAPCVLPPAFEVSAQEYNYEQTEEYHDQASFHTEQGRKERGYHRQHRKQQREERREQRFKQRFHETDDENTEDGPKWEQINALGQFLSAMGPRDVVQGVKTGLATAAIGMISSFGCLIGTPYLLSPMGWPGIVLGLVLGGIGSAGALLVSFGIAAASVGIGLWKTPKAIYASWFQRKKWDSEEREWKHYTLDEEAEEILKSETARTSVSDSTYYDVLDIKPGSTSKDIKRAYFSKAKLVHPDKNPNDEEAAAQFIQLHKAYQTLSDPKLREDYDQFGSSSSFGAGGFNAEVFFEILFASQLVEPYIGQLAVASFVNRIQSLSQLSSDDASQATIDLSVFWQNSKLQKKKRSVQVAQHLRERIQSFVNGSMSDDEFIDGCLKEADEIASSGFGEIFLVHIGSSLVQEANLYLQKNILKVPLWIYSSVSKKVRGVKSTIGGMKQLATLFAEMNAESEGETSDVNKSSSRRQSTEESKFTEEYLETFLPQILELAWAYNARDIASLIEKASFKVLNDSSATSSHERRRRALALRLLGQSFLERGSLNEYEENQSNLHSIKDGTSKDMKMKKLEEIKARVHVAYQAALSQEFKASSEESEELIRRAKQGHKNY